METPSFLARKSLIVIAALALVAIAYALMNQQQLVHRVLYRLAAHDTASALANFAALCVQALALLFVIIALPRRWFAAVFILVMVSAGVAMGYQQVMGEVLDAPTLGWIFGERRLAADATATFLVPLAIALVKWLAVGALLLAARKMLFIADATRPVAIAALIALICAPFPFAAADISAIGSERALYHYGTAVLLAEAPPPRAAVALSPQAHPGGPPRVTKIVWLVDESIVYSAYRRLVAPSLVPYRPFDYGLVAAMANCSSPANVAMRSGVSVDTISPTTDLRTTPSIWGYARHAGYRTRMIDGQVSGAPQNLMLPPERALIDEYIAASDGYDTDRSIARRINRELKAPGKSFTYVVLQGAHFQYRDHYPPKNIPADSPLIMQYDAAVAYSKRGFFDALLAGVDRERIAIVYTSDHGQNVQSERPPHCSATPVRAEYEVPLAILLPSAYAPMLAADEPGGRSQSQIFPSTLRLMGYDRADVERHYDNLLDRPTRRYVDFGRAVFPLAKGDAIDVETGKAFPGS